MDPIHLTPIRASSAGASQPQRPSRFVPSDAFSSVLSLVKSLGAFCCPHLMNLSSPIPTTTRLDFAILCRYILYLSIYYQCLSGGG